MSISVITTNVYPGKSHVETIIKNLGVQTCKDFEWVFVDAFQEENAQLVRDLSESHGLKRVVHAPICAATHVGRIYHWETYNNALLLSSEKCFLRLGVYRYFHHQVVEFAVEQASKGRWVNLAQRQIEEFDPACGHEEMVSRHQMEVQTKSLSNRMECQCGMFSFGRQIMIQMNGNNEALLIHHWEDADFNSRCVQLGNVELMSLHNAFLRIHHYKGLKENGPYRGKLICKKEDNPNCIYYPYNNHKIEEYAFPDMHWFEYRGFRWVKCDVCGTVAVGHADKYFEFLKTNKLGFRAPVNVGGVGRNITIMDDDMAKLVTLSSKVELLAASHTNPRYLQE